MNYVALLRGINVGGKNMLPMRDLAQMFAKAGCTNVQTYIQSGNVIFSANRALAEKVPSVIAKKIAGQFGYTVPVVLRSADEVGDIIQNNPFLKAGARKERDGARGDKALTPEDMLHVYFLASLPQTRDVAALDPARSLPDTFVVRGREVYVHLPNGMARTKLSNAWFDSKLATISTARNWRTVLKLFELTQG